MTAAYSYDEIYIDGAQRVMGDMFDYSVNTLKQDISDFTDMFIISGMAHQFEIGNPTFIAGKNGCEIARLVLEKCGISPIITTDEMYVDKSVEYWIGWALSYYQWYSSIPYKYIFQKIPIKDFFNMYPTFHEMDIDAFVETMNIRLASSGQNSTLRRLRLYANLSQSELAKITNVPLRQIQLFEQGQRDIKKTQGSTLFALAKGLNCSIEELLF